MVKLQILIPEKEDMKPILKTMKTPPVLPVTIRNVRRAEENKEAQDFISILSNVLLFIGFLLILISVKIVWDLKIENWRLIKENAALKKTVRDNVAVEKFRNYIPSEADILQFERPAIVEPPNLSWSVSVRIFWSPPFITPCDMNWLSTELAEQIYNKKTELDQERMEETQEVQEKQIEDILKREERTDDIQEILENELEGTEENERNNIEKIWGFTKEDNDEMTDNVIDEYQVMTRADGEMIEELMGRVEEENTEDVKENQWQGFAEDSGVAGDFNGQIIILEDEEPSMDSEFPNMDILLNLDVDDETDTV